jgi:hypothetical protein
MQILIFFVCIMLSRFIEVLKTDDFLISNKYYLYIIRSLIPLVVFMCLEYLFSFLIRKDEKLGFRSIMSGI